MVVKLTQEQADYLETFQGRKKTAIYYIARSGWGYFLEDGLGNVYKTKEEFPFDISDEKEKMLDAIINGYEIDVPKYKFHTFSNITGFEALYYAGKNVQLTSNGKEAKNIVKNSDEYLALKSLGFLEEEV